MAEVSKEEREELGKLLEDINAFYKEKVFSDTSNAQRIMRVANLFTMKSASVMASVLATCVTESARESTIDSIARDFKDHLKREVKQFAELNNIIKTKLEPGQIDKLVEEIKKNKE